MMANVSLVPRPPPFLFVGLHLVHGSGRGAPFFYFRVIILNANSRTKKGGRPGNEARQMWHNHEAIYSSHMPPFHTNCMHDKG